MSTNRIAYIRALDLKSQSEQINKINSYGCDESFSELIDGKLNKDKFDKLISRLPFKELVMVNLHILPLNALQSIEFIAFMHRRKVKITFLEHSLDIETILLLDEINKQYRRERSDSILKKDNS